MSLGRDGDTVGAFVLVDEVYLDAAAAVQGQHGPALSAARLDGPVRHHEQPDEVVRTRRSSTGLGDCPAAIADRLRRTRDVIDNAGSAPADRLAALAVSRRAGLLDRAKAILGANLSLAHTFLANHPMLEVPEPPGSSVVFPRILGRADAEPFIHALLENHGVAVAPGRFFDSPAHFRVSLAGANEALVSRPCRDSTRRSSSPV